MDTERTRVCPVELAGSLDNRIRRWIQNPEKIVDPYLRDGMTVLDIGCGPGFFSVPMAKMVGPAGKVIAADLQEGMLQKVAKKIRGTEVESRIELVKCDTSSINVSAHVDFILAFFMVHEVPDKNALFAQLADVLNDDGKILLIEPKLFHVSKKEFAETLDVAAAQGLEVSQRMQRPFTWWAVLRRRQRALAG